jgi:hypothetical protein
VADPVLATLGVVISTAVVGLTFFVVTPWLGLAVPLLYCLIFGALISPTDPVAVLAVIKRVGVPKSLETRVAGESISIALALSLPARAISIAEPSIDPSDKFLCDEHRDNHNDEDHDPVVRTLESDLIAEKQSERLEDYKLRTK